MAKSGTISFLCLCLFLLLLVPAKAQQLYDSNIQFSTKRKRVTLPFKLVHNLIIIPVQINNSPPLNFILDSGVKNILITRLNYTDSVNLNSASEIEIKGLGTGHSIKALFSRANDLQIKTIRGSNHNVYVLMEDVLDISTRMGMPIHGLIGYDLFKNFIVRINYSTERITFYEPGAKVKVGKKAEHYPLYLEGERAYIYANVKQHNGEVVKVKLVVDTGASNTISLYLPSNKELSLPPKVMEAHLGRGLSGDINGKIGRINSFNIGRHELFDLPAAFPNEEDIKLVLNMSNRNGSLGSDILKRFTVILDYPHNQLALVPNSKYKQPFTYNVTGLEISTPLPGVPVYMVANVIKGSIAEAAGIRAGDQLVTINGNDCKKLSLTEVVGYFDRKPGRAVKLQMLRDGKSYDVRLILKYHI